MGNQTSKSRFKILLLGLDAVGKTTMLYKIKLGEITTTIRQETATAKAP